MAASPYKIEMLLSPTHAVIVHHTHAHYITVFIHPNTLLSWPANTEACG